MAPSACGTRVHAPSGPSFGSALLTFLDVPVSDTDDALPPIAPHEVGVAAVVQQRQGGVDGGAQRDLLREFGFVSEVQMVLTKVGVKYRVTHDAVK